MAPEIRQHLRVRVDRGIAIVGFVDSYLQSEDVVQETSQQLLGLLAEKGYSKVLLHFDGVRFLSSEMIAGVVKMHKKMAQSKGKLRLCGLAPTLRDVFRVSQLDRLLEIFDDERGALAKF